MAELRDGTRNDLLDMPTLIVEPFEIPELGLRYWLRAISQEELEKWEESNKVDKESGELLPGVRARLLIKALCDRHGNPLLTENDMPVFLKQLHRWIGAMFGAATKLNTLTKEAVDDVKKNLPPIPTGASDSDSHLNSAESPLLTQANSSAA